MLFFLPGTFQWFQFLLFVSQTVVGVGGQVLGGSPNAALSPGGGKGIGFSTVESLPVSSARAFLRFASSVRTLSSLGKCSEGKLYLKEEQKM